MTQKSKVYKKNEHQKILVFQWFYLLERLLLMDATAAINGIQEVSGSIPLISTKSPEILRFQDFLLSENRCVLGVCKQSAQIIATAVQHTVHVDIVPICPVEDHVISATVDFTAD